MTAYRKLLVLLTVALAGLAVATAGIATAAGASVSLKLKREYRRHHVTACHRAEDYRLFHRSARIEWEGFLTPAPAGHFPARLEIRRCVRGGFHRVAVRATTGKKLTGKFKGLFSARPFAPRSHSRHAITYYFAFATAGGGRSKKVFFGVTN